ncbi:hypothetical protein BACCAP_00504 [Pseudoflavonifractor capillosus ATCC 29799]|uniref:Uncharacterized protein n=1 Tax=Pseudoflavonifractor capillosus ATCC 29799 TaxID=411467 RepID=A6NQN3_9FIRM|nr:hypothetical protein [Pseudoflavonifractor capillosus]EDN01379.1 hypothetical protein BACCAP_00504 [Pseudoflavonifractor capillosus ATCC 29799]
MPCKVTEKMAHFSKFSFSSYPVLLGTGVKIWYASKKVRFIVQILRYDGMERGDAPWREAQSKS